MKHLRLGHRLLLGGVLMVLAPIIVIGFISVYKSTQSISTLVSQNMRAMSENLANNLNEGLARELAVTQNVTLSNSIIAAAEQVAREGEAKSRNEISEAEKELTKSIKLHPDRYSAIFLAKKDGVVFADGVGGAFKGMNFSDREYFQKAVKGTANTGQMIFSRKTPGKVVCTSAAPIYSAKGSEITGVAVISLELRFLTDIVDAAKIGKTGYSYIVDKNGLYVTHPVKANILKTHISQMKGMEPLATQVQSGVAGVREHELEGVSEVAAVHPVPITGWSVITTIPSKELYEPAISVRNLIVFTGIFFLVLAIALFYLFAGSITRPLNRMVDAARRISSGDLNVNVTAGNRRDEIGDLADAFTRMIESLREKANVARRIARNDLTVKVTPQSSTDILGEALAMMVEKLRTQIQEIVAGVNVLASSGSGIMASVSQLTAGAMETSTAVSETTATAEEVKQTAEATSEKARHLSELGQKTAEISRIGLKSIEDTAAGMNRIREQMESVADMIVRLSEQSQTVGAIISTVDDLAEQSNLLAVNASIEAAKAGEQGKGFGVVAQEIRSLAEQSKRATTQVRNILFDVQKAVSSAVMATEQGNKAVDEGVRLSEQAGESIETLAQSSAEVMNAAIQIAASSRQQLAGMNQMVSAMESIREASSQTAVSTKQTESTAHDLHDLGLRLKGIVSEYKI